MINAGAIATVVAGGRRRRRAARLARVVGAMSAYAGRPLDIDEAVFESERATGHRNRAIGHMLRNYDIVERRPGAGARRCTSSSARCCVDCRDLALMAATLANGGVNPVTGAARGARRAHRPDPQRDDHLRHVRLHRRMGLPRRHAGQERRRRRHHRRAAGAAGHRRVLAARSTSAATACAASRSARRISRDLGLHFLQPPRAVGGHRARPLHAGRRALQAPPAAGREPRCSTSTATARAVYELQGDLRFATIEPVLREIVDAGAGAALRGARLQARDATPTPPPRACWRAWSTLLRRARPAPGADARAPRRPAGRLRHRARPARTPRAVSFQPQLDLGLEWCERGAAASATRAGAAPHAPIAGLAEHRLCAGASAGRHRHLAARVERCQFEAGSLIVRRGDAADALYFLMRGEVSVDRRRCRRAATSGCRRCRPAWASASRR